MQKPLPVVVLSCFSCPFSLSFRFTSTWARFLCSIVRHFEILLTSIANWSFVLYQFGCLLLSSSLLLFILFPSFLFSFFLIFSCDALGPTIFQFFALPALLPFRLCHLLVAFFKYKHFRWEICFSFSFNTLFVNIATLHFAFHSFFFSFFFV